MSVEATAWAFRQDVPSGQKWVLVALANACDHADQSFCGHHGLAEVTGLSPRTVGAHLGWLEERGLIERHQRAAQGGRRKDRVTLVRVGRVQ